MIHLGYFGSNGGLVIHDEVYRLWVGVDLDVGRRLRVGVACSQGCGYFGRSTSVRAKGGPSAIP